WIWEPTFGEIPELDGDDRIGVIHDPGADEFVLPTLYPHGRTRVGQTFDLRATANPNELVPMFASAGVLAAPLGGFFWLASPALPLATPLSDADGLVSVPIAVPAVPAWIGLDAYVQAFRAAGGGVYDGSRPLWIRLLP